MFEVAVQITGVVSEDFPGFLSCELIDAHSRVWAFVEKAPIVTPTLLDLNGAPPQFGNIRCEVLSESTDAAGLIVLRIDTSRPDGVEATDGTHEFDVFAHQVSKRAVGV